MRKIQRPSPRPPKHLVFDREDHEEEPPRLIPDREEYDKMLPNSQRPSRKSSKAKIPNSQVRKVMREDTPFLEDFPLVVREPRRKKIIRYGPGTIADFKLLLRICEDFEKNKRELFKIPRNVIEWISEFSQYAINKGVRLKANEYIVKYRKATYKN